MLASPNCIRYVSIFDDTLYGRGLSVMMGKYPAFARYRVLGRAGNNDMT